MTKFTQLAVALLGSSPQLAAVLLGSSMLAGGATGATICAGLTDASERYCRLSHLSERTQAECDAFDRSIADFCGAANVDLIQASAAATGIALDLLHDDYDVQQFGTEVPQFASGHVVVAPSDLDDADVIALLHDAYRRGKTVAVVEARPADADKFQQIVTGGGEASCSEGSSPGIALYGLQQTSTQHPRLQATYCASDLDSAQTTLARQWLDERFAPAPPQAPAATPSAETQAAVATQAAPGSENIEDLDIQAALCSAYDAKNGSEITINSYTSGLRDLQQLIDYYYVDQLIQTTSTELDDPRLVNNEWDQSGTITTEFPDLIYADPATQTVTGASYTNSSSTTTSSTVGFNQSQGVNASVSESVTVGESQTVSVPPISIQNQSKQSTGTTQWEFDPANGSLPPNDDFAPQMQWVWAVAMNDYVQPLADPPNNQILYATTVDMFTSGVDYTVTCTVPYPFNVWAIEAPVITGTTPASVQAGGGRFTVNGSGLYPSLVQNVLLAGDALPRANYTLDSDTQISVTVPSGVSDGNQPLEVVTTNGSSDLSSNTVTISITK